MEFFCRTTNKKLINTTQFKEIVLPKHLNYKYLVKVIFGNKKVNNNKVSFQFKLYIMF